MTIPESYGTFCFIFPSRCAVALVDDPLLSSFAPHSLPDDMGRWAVPIISNKLLGDALVQNFAHG